jgi:cytochrome c biogenesis protein ResB
VALTDTSGTAQPTRIDVRGRLRRFWREYTRMRTAIFFLIGVSLIVLIGSFVPQQDTSAQSKVDQFLADHHNLNDLGTHVGLPLTQVFVAPLFFVLLGSLYLALGACVLRRGRALVMRTVRRHPRTPQFWGEWGSWLFHTSFFLLLVAVVWGKATGFQGIVTVTEGQRVSEARASYDTLQEGLLFDGRHSGYQVQLNKFEATYQANGQPNDFVSSVTVYEGGKPVLTKDVRVNDFLGYKDVDFYQQDYGWAPRILVRNPAGQVVYDGTIDFFGAQKNVQTGVLKVPDFNYTIPGAQQPIQLGARMAVFPDARTIAKVNPDGSIATGQTNFGPGGEQARNPVVQVQLWVGDLGLDRGRPQNVNQLDTGGMSPYLVDAAQNNVPFPITLGESKQLVLPGTDAAHPQTFTITFAALKQYSLFMVKKDNGVPLVYLTFLLIMTGLMVKLYLKPALDRRWRGRRGAKRTALQLPPISTRTPAPAPEQEREPAGV